ncbi:uncharacterized protein LOC110405246 [Numida meleagris]|uniref:uncharacterized protein LOC110405246 n=1 Tax=Numida meleagris TaxID=8996 RepID=UPI000B3DFD52|nr:uncharacterized protein LOC110405246 [Numida meleagris]
MKLYTQDNTQEHMLKRGWKAKPGEPGAGLARGCSCSGARRCAARQGGTTGTGRHGRARPLPSCRWALSAAPELGPARCRLTNQPPGAWNAWDGRGGRGCLAAALSASCYRTPLYLSANTPAARESPPVTALRALRDFFRLNPNQDFVCFSKRPRCACCCRRPHVPGAAQRRVPLRGALPGPARHGSPRVQRGAAVSAQACKAGPAQVTLLGREAPVCHTAGWPNPAAQRGCAGAARARDPRWSRSPCSAPGPRAAAAVTNLLPAVPPLVTACLPHLGRDQPSRWGWCQKRRYNPQRQAVLGSSSAAEAPEQFSAELRTLHVF